MSENIANDQSPVGDEISILELTELVAQNIRLLVFGPLLLGLIALGISFLITPTFTGRTVIVPPQQNQGLANAMLSQVGGVALLAGAAGILKSPVEQYVALLRSTTIADRLIDRFKLLERYGVKYRVLARRSLTGNTTITSGKDGLIVIEVDDDSPRLAAEMANAYVTELQTLLGSLALTEAQYRRLFYEAQLQKAKTKLAESERALGEIGVGSSAIKASPAASIETVARLRALVTAQEVKLSAMRGYLADSAPDFRQAQMELAALQTQLGKQEESEPKAAAPGGYIEKYRDFKYQETLFELLARQFELARIDESRDGTVVQIVDPALPPELKSRPKKALIAVVTTILSGFLMLVWVLVRRAITRSATRPEDAARLESIRAGLARLLPQKRKS